MSEMCKNIYKKYINCYMAIQTLDENGLFDEEEKAVYHNLLNSIMVTLKEEVEE